MRYVITTATAVALIAGIALGFVASRGLDGAASAAPAETKVREQNLDGSGLIRVHEQGTANVNVTNTSVPVSGTVDVGNLPSVQDVSVVSMPPADAGPFEYKNVIGGLASGTSTGWCHYAPAYLCGWDLDGELTALSGSGWQVTHVTGGGATGTVVFTLRRPAP